MNDNRFTIIEVCNLRNQITIKSELGEVFYYKFFDRIPSTITVGDKFGLPNIALTRLISVEEDDEETSTEEFMCPDCKEWTSMPDPCCGIGPGRYNEDSLNEDR